MSISPHLRKVNDRFSHLERCAQMAPEGTYQQAKDVSEMIGSLSNKLLRTLRAMGMKALNDDRLRNVEAAVYAYVLESNPDASGLLVGEGFGEHVDGPAGDRIIAVTVRDRDFLKTALEGTTAIV